MQAPTEPLPSGPPTSTEATLPVGPATPTLVIATPLSPPPHAWTAGVMPFIALSTSSRVGVGCRFSLGAAAAGFEDDDELLLAFFPPSAVSSRSSRDLSADD